MPKVVGTLPEKIEDPVLIEIFGMHPHYFEGLAEDLDEDGVIHLLRQR